jgi:hypothetical protein
VSITKSKADKNKTDIETLKGGLPAEREARIAADANLQSQIDVIISLICDDGIDCTTAILDMATGQSSYMVAIISPSFLL